MTTMNDRVRQLGNLPALRSLLVGLLLLVLPRSGSNRFPDNPRNIFPPMAGASVTSEPISQLVPSGRVDPKPVRSIFVDLLPTPDPMRLSRLELAPVENLDDVELIGLVQRVDRAIVLMSPDISYVGILASRYLEGKFPEFVYSRRVVLCLTCLSIQA